MKNRAVFNPSEFLKKTSKNIVGFFKIIPHLAPLFYDENPQRRMFERFRAEENTYIAFSNPFKRDGKLIDISHNGVAFLYFVEKGQIKDFFDLDIFLGDESFYLEKIPCRIVSDVDLAGGKSEGARRCGVQFRELTDSQKRRLEYFLKNHTKSEQFVASHFLCADLFVL